MYSSSDKKNGRFNVFAAILVVFCAIHAVAQDGSLCTVNGIMGKVKVLGSRSRGSANPADANTWPDARLNMTLRDKDIIATLAESEVRLEMPDGSSVRLRENTTIEVAMLKGGAEAMNARLKLNEGGIVANVKKVAGGKSTFEIETPTSLAAIRGTTVELDQRAGTGSTLKTFDGLVQVAPANSKKFTDVGHYQMTEVGSGQNAAASRAIPSHYKQKSTKLLSEYDMSMLTGFTRVMLTYDELNETKRKLENDGIPCAIGMAISEDEMIARTMSADEARKQLAVAMSTQVQRISESYSQNIDGKAQTVWEEGVRQLTDVSVRGSTVYSTITQRNPNTKQFRVYSLMVLEPDRFKNAMVASRTEGESELRAKKDDMISKLDASISAYNTRYHDR